ncbi:response regulator [Pedobacter cryoconitis]|uniref:response regulator n=1 Tax=Pedobacter cryoconitis TaxID=188932 RepID=UPI00161EB9A8|nr:response regulator [Pedobacter cryoconitis]MBB5647188.1 polysaccharide export outer membrane protein [Pedobacter cryoconitis]
MEASQKFKIFLIDDDIFCLNLYKIYLENENYQDITIFESETTCLNRLTENPDVIFLDYGLNNLSGIEVLKKIKRFNPDIFVVFLSGQANIATAVNALKFGAFDYIVKGPDELTQIIKVLSKIKEIQEAMKQKAPGLIRKIFSLF